MSREVSIAEAKAHLSVCVREVEQGSPILITRHGKQVAALVPAADLQHLERLRSAGPEGGLASLAGGWEGSEELADQILASKRSSARDIDDLN